MENPPEPAAASVPDPPPPPVPDPPAKPTVESWGPIVLLVGGGLAVLAATLPWATASAGIFSVSKAGTEGDGVITLVAGLVVAFLGLIALTRGATRKLMIAGGVIGLGMAALAFYDIANVRDTADETDILVQVGVGLWLTAVAGVLSAAPLLAQTKSRA
jgi:hypothetical protein